MGFSYKQTISNIYLTLTISYIKNNIKFDKNLYKSCVFFSKIWPVEYIHDNDKNFYNIKLKF